METMRMDSPTRAIVWGVRLSLCGKGMNIKT
jgi:hypothetical protein